MSDLLQPAQHPDADQLTAFVENALPPHERDQTLAHLAACPHCRQIVFLAQPSEPELLPQPIPTRKPLFAGWNLAWISAGALAAAGAITVTLRTHPTPARTIQQTIDTASVEDLPSPAPTPASPTPLQLAPAKPAAKTPNPIDNGRQAATVGGQQVAQLLPYSPLLHHLQSGGLSKRAAEEALGTDPRDLELNLRKLLQTSQSQPFSDQTNKSK